MSKPQLIVLLFLLPLPVFLLLDTLEGEALCNGEAYRVAKTHRMPLENDLQHIGCQLQVIFRKRATNYMALLRKMTSTYRASCGSSPPCTHN